MTSGVRLHDDRPKRRQIAGTLLMPPEFSGMRSSDFRRGGGRRPDPGAAATGEGKMLQLRINVCPRIPLREGLPDASGRSYAGLVHAPGGPLYAGISCRSKTVFSNQDLKTTIGCC